MERILPSNLEETEEEEEVEEVKLDGVVQNNLTVRRWSSRRRRGGSGGPRH